MPIHSNRILLVEGDDDKQLLYQLFNLHNILPRGTYAVKDKRGYENLVDTLDDEVDGSEVTQLGIIVDADEHPEHRWTSLRNKLMECGYTEIPKHSNSEGVIVHHDSDFKPTVGLWMMPDNLSSGAVEDFAQMLIPQQDSLWPRAQKAVEQIPDSERLFPPQHLNKALIHTWLAWQEEPGKPMGLAIRKKYLSGNAPHAQMLMEWIKKLFEIGG